jgi:DNA polymerase-3 subunit delta'
VRFRRLPASEVAGVLESEGLASGPEAQQAARSAAGNLDGARRLAADPDAREWRGALLTLVYGVLSRADVDAGDAANAVLTRVTARGRAEEERLEAERDRALELIGGGSAAAKKEEKRLRDHYKALIPRRRRRAELQELRATLDVIETALRDLLCASLGADAAIVERGRLREIEDVAVVLGNARATTGLAAVRHTRETLLLPVDRTLAMQALWHRLASLRPADREARSRP